MKHYVRTVLGRRDRARRQGAALGDGQGRQNATSALPTRECLTACAARRCWRHESQVLAIMGRRVRTSSLVILDACRDNPFARSLVVGLSDEERGRFMVRSGLAEVRAATGAFVAFATAPDNVAFDGTGTNSPFTAALTAHMDAPDLSINDMMIAVRRDVLKVTGGKQEPWDQSSLRRRFCFNEPLPLTKPSDDLPKLGAAPLGLVVDERTIEHTRWLTLQNSGSIVDLQGFLVRFPNGNYAEDASRLLRTRLRECSEDETSRAIHSQIS